MLSRKELLKSMLLAGAAPNLVLAQVGGSGQEAQATDITLDDLKAVERIAGISFTDDERKAILNTVRSSRRGFENVRKAGIDYTTEPRTVFTPIGGGSLPNAKVEAKPSPLKGPIALLSDEDIAFLSVRELGHLIRSKKLSPVRLTEIYLARLKQYGDKLLCVVNLTEDLARKQAKQAESEINAGHYRGPLHGIPYGIKDLFAVKGYPTTWSANVYEHRVFDYDATIVKKLEAAGAILLAKLSNGTFAQGDLWYKGRTKNPWNPAQGSSGSSAGSAAATAAGLVAFGIGTETLGSIMSPSGRCRVTGLRPTYGRVSRYGGMALSYTMDKVGPICREAEDCALVLAAICGSDPMDPSAVDRSFSWPPRMNLKGWRVGYSVGASADLNDKSVIDKEPPLAALKRMGADIRLVKFTPADQSLLQILNVESASAFDEFTRGEDIRRLNESAWPNTFRAARYVPAVEYLQAMRARTLLMQTFERELGDLDVVYGNNLLFITNLTGHPQMCIPWGTAPTDNSQSKVFAGRIYGEDRLASVVRAVQETAAFHGMRPDLSKL